MNPTEKRPLGEQLKERGLITDDQLRIALFEQKRTGLALGKQLLALGFVSDAVLRDGLSSNLGHQSVDLAQTIPDARALALVPKELARRHALLPLAWDPDHGVLTVAMANPSNLVAFDQMQQQFRQAVTISPQLASEADVINAIDLHYGFELSIDGILNEIETGEVDWNSLAGSENEFSQPVTRLIDALLADAVMRGASDIHFEPEESFIRIRYRIDGVLRQIRAIHRTYWPAMVVRIKVISNMNITETRAPQDGRLSRTLAGRPVDFRVAAQPTTWGENIVLRILDRNKGLLPLEKLGWSEHNLGLLRRMMSRPEGIILVTGPTGSGKTTTLYSILSEISSEQVNIMTLEDPVEYPLPLIRQTSLNEVSKMDFASGIRSLMRQDPDIILVGEVRDRETADMAFRAAMTGHQVYSTLHTNSALGALPRLNDIGVLPDIIAGNIIGIIGQRLVRKLCTRCRERVGLGSFERRMLGLGDEDDVQHIYRAAGCESCEHQGYRGRIAIVEVLKLDDELDELIAMRAPRHELNAAALRNGLVTLLDDACRLVIDGVTSLDEIARVVDLGRRMEGG
ncbi:GspE/PulE family protein [Chitinibacteraceae bacterium HSL-7]